MGTLHYPWTYWPFHNGTEIELWPAGTVDRQGNWPDNIRPICASTAQPKENPVPEGDKMIVVDLTASDPKHSGSPPSSQPPPATTRATLVCVGEGEPTRHTYVGREPSVARFLGQESHCMNLIFRCERCLACRVWGNESVASDGEFGDVA